MKNDKKFVFDDNWMKLLIHAEIQQQFDEKLLISFEYLELCYENLLEEMLLGHEVLVRVFVFDQGGNYEYRKVKELLTDLVKAHIKQRPNMLQYLLSQFLIYRKQKEKSQTFFQNCLVLLLTQLQHQIKYPRFVQVYLLINLINKLFTVFCLYLLRTVNNFTAM